MKASSVHSFIGKDSSLRVRLRTETRASAFRVLGWSWIQEIVGGGQWSLSTKLSVTSLKISGVGLASSSLQTSRQFRWADRSTLILPSTVTVLRWDMTMSSSSCGRPRRWLGSLPACSCWVAAICCRLREMMKELCLIIAPFTGRA
jgi:hypothetical protein